MYQVKNKKDWEKINPSISISISMGLSPCIYLIGFIAFEPSKNLTEFTARIGLVAKSMLYIYAIKQTIAKKAPSLF